MARFIWLTATTALKDKLILVNVDQIKLVEPFQTGSVVIFASTYGDSTDSQYVAETLQEIARQIEYRSIGRRSDAGE